MIWMFYSHNHHIPVFIHSKYFIHFQYIYIYTYYMEITLREIVNSFIQEQISSKEITFQ